MKDHHRIKRINANEDEYNFIYYSFSLVYIRVIR